jgi:hypothetical protein
VVRVVLPAEHCFRHALFRTLPLNTPPAVHLHAAAHLLLYLQATRTHDTAFGGLGWEQGRLGVEDNLTIYHDLSGGSAAKVLQVAPDGQLGRADSGERGRQDQQHAAAYQFAQVTKCMHAPPFVRFRDALVTAAPVVA